MSSPPNNLPLIGDVLADAAERMEQANLFFGHGTDNAWDEACALLFEVLDVPPDVGESIGMEPFPEIAMERFQSLLTRRITEQLPMAYLLGKAWFGGFPFIVNANVLVPRSPLAELIQRDFSPWYRGQPLRILDLCAGSGCLGILCAHQFPRAEVTLAELSPEAIEVARQNTAMHGLDDRISLVEGDLFEALPQQKFDIILSNPPYVDAEDMNSLPAEFRHEPSLGLASGADGLDITRRILAQAERWLDEEGLLVIEVGNSWEALESAYPKVPFTWVELERGGHGVFVLNGTELRQFNDSFHDAYNRRADQ